MKSFLSFNKKKYETFCGLRLNVDDDDDDDKSINVMMYQKRGSK